MAVQRSFYVLAALAALACGSDPTPPPVSPTPMVEPEPPPPPPPPPEKPGDDPRQSNINVSDEIAVACGITDAEAKFSYDSARVQKGDQPVPSSTCSHGMRDRFAVRLWNGPRPRQRLRIQARPNGTV